MNSPDHPIDGQMIALHYTRKESATAESFDDTPLTQRIMAFARQQGMEHAINTELTTRLARGSLSPEIPVELYQAAAQVLAFVWSTSQSP